MALTETVNADSMLKTALEFAQGFKGETIELADGREFILAPNGFALKEITDPQHRPIAPEGNRVFDEKDALIDYLNRFREPETVAFADMDEGTIRAVIDYHAAWNDPEEEGATRSGLQRHVATLRLRESEEFKRWNEISGKLMPQYDFAMFLEENAVDIVEPESGQIIELSRDIHGSIGGAFKNKVDLSSGDRTLHYSSETQPNADLVIPKKITLEIPIYQGEEPIALTMLFRYRLSGEGGCALGVQWHRAIYQQLALFRGIAAAISEGTGVPVYLGR